MVDARPPVTPASAQTFNQMKSFAPRVLNSATGFSTNSDGAYPQADLILSGDTLYGVASAGGAEGAGTIFKINADGSGFAVIKHFSGSASDGATPSVGVIMPGNTLIGTTGLTQ
jgi:uncharacterized repeat protein (TIGR03803 family)